MDWVINNVEIFIFGLVFFLFFCAVGYAIYQAKKRHDALAAMAPRMGFDFKPRDDSFRDSHSHLKMFSRGHSHRMTNVMEGVRDGIKVLLADYHYTTGSGKNSSSHDQTICIITDPDFKLPNFYLRREFSFLDYLGKLFGGQDINFKEDEKFSAAFVLQGTVEAETRSFFNSEVRNEFVKFAGQNIQVEGQDDSLIVHQSLTLEPEKWLALLKDAFAIYRALKNREGGLLD